jgi:serine/threonine protein phosphatase 1
VAPLAFLGSRGAIEFSAMSVDVAANSSSSRSMQTKTRTYMLTIVIGDIHGMAAKLENLLGQIDMWCSANAKAELRQLIFLGDYIDRGPDSRQVLQIVQRLQAEGAICLRGNHEELMLRATESESDLTTFLANGGDATITSLGAPAAFWRAQEWMRTGIRPGVPLELQTTETKLWIRYSFLRHRGPFPKYIVHGHTPAISLDPKETKPDVRDNRCNVDTGAGMNGPLSAAIFNDRQMKPINTISVGAEN